MILIVGLGNPGKKYQATRHNIGRLVVSNWQKTADFSDFKFQKKFNALISKRIFDKNKIILALPEAFMNLSGKVVKTLTTYYQLPAPNLWIVHDDIDLPLGKIRISRGRGAAGHKGVGSIIKELGTKDFVRFRIGIKPRTHKPKNVEKFVLEEFSKKEKGIMQRVIKKTIEAVKFSLKEGVEKAMQKYNQ